MPNNKVQLTGNIYSLIKEFRQNVEDIKALSADPNRVAGISGFNRSLGYLNTSISDVEDYIKQIESGTVTSLDRQKMGEQLKKIQLSMESILKQSENISLDPKMIGRIRKTAQSISDLSESLFARPNSIIMRNAPGFKPATITFAGQSGKLKSTGYLYTANRVGVKAK